MATCPNINLDSWKSLVATHGEDVAYYLWDKYDGSVPNNVTYEADEFINYRFKNEAVNTYYNKVMSENDKIKLIPASATEKRHYTHDGEKVPMSVTELVKSKNKGKFDERTGILKVEDDQTKEWGSKGHAFMEAVISKELIDKDGYAIKNPAKVSIDTDLNPIIQQKLRDFARQLIKSYPPGTRFLVEKKIVNTKTKELLASTFDFKAIVPDVKTGFKVDTLDWKFVKLNKEENEDIPFYKQNEWKEQMGEYVKMDRSYGVTTEQTGKSRMIPIIANYGYVIPGDRESGLVLNSIEVGDVNNIKDSKLYLLPVPLNSETTGNKQVDNLLTSLRHQYETLYKKKVNPEDKRAKNLQLNELSKAIRSLHLQLDFAPIASVGTTFLHNAAKAFQSFKDIDYNKLTKDEVELKLKELIDYERSAEKYADLDDIFLSHFSKEGLSAKDKQTLLALEDITAKTSRMLDAITNLRKEFVVQLALKEELTTIETQKTILDAEREVDVASKTFLEGSKLPAKIINLASNMIMNAASLVNIRLSRRVNDFGELLAPLEKEAKALGKTAFDMIGKIKDGGLNLIQKIDKKFYDDVKEAKEAGDKQFFLDNMDVNKYNELAKEFIDKNITEINATTFSTDKDDDYHKKEYKIKQLRNSLEIGRDTFNGYKDYDFNRFFKQVMLEEKHYSQDYKNMIKSKAALEMWKYFTTLNEKAISMGYLSREGVSFFPLMEASVLQKFSTTSDSIQETKDFFKDLYTVRINEEQKYSKIDPETGKLKKEIPTYFKRTNKDVHQLSTDLNKVGVLWLRSLLQYEASKQMENTLLTLHAVEKAKGHLVTDDSQELVYENGGLKVDLKTNKNADILGTIIDDALYNLGENLDSFGNTKISQLSDKLKGENKTAEQTTLSIKKSFDVSNKLVQALAVGLKPLISLANVFGFNFQAFINAGNLMKFGEFMKNNSKVITGIGLTTTDKGLLDLIVPLNEDIAKEKMRHIAKGQSYIKWLGTWNFTDVMMSTNSFPEKRLQMATALSIIENSMIDNGKIVNIRQFIKAQDRVSKKGMSESDRRALEKTYEDRVSALKESSSLSKSAKIENDKIVIPGVSDEELAKYRTKITEFIRNLNGQINSDNKAGYRRDTIFRSFMMFKNWIPKQLSLRTLDIKKNTELGEWEYGRARVFIKTWAQLGIRNIGQMRDIIQGTDKGLSILNEMLEKKRDDYFRKTGQKLEISDEEFYDLIRTELSNEMKELALLVGLIGVVIAAKVAVPPDDADALEKNRYKYWAKGINKISDEISFYYNPLSFESMTKGSVLPALGLLTKVERMIVATSALTVAEIKGDDKAISKAHPVKYGLDIIPGISQFNRDILPLISPETAKDMGIVVSSQARQQ